MSVSASSQAAAYRRLHQEYLLSYAGGGEELITGAAALASALRLSPTSITVYLSRGSGEFSVRKQNPLTGELDICTITRLAKPIPPRYGAPLPEPKPRGRPRKERLEQP